MKNILILLLSVISLNSFSQIDSVGQSTINRIDKTFDRELKVDTLLKSVVILTNEINGLKLNQQNIQKNLRISHKQYKTGGIMILTGVGMGVLGSSYTYFITQKNQKSIEYLNSSIQNNNSNRQRELSKVNLKPLSESQKQQLRVDINGKYNSSNEYNQIQNIKNDKRPKIGYGIVGIGSLLSVVGSIKIIMSHNYIGQAGFTIKPRISGLY